VIVGSCSGTFVSRDAVLTAGHCLYNEGQWVQDIVVVPGKDANFDPYGHEFAASWWVPDQWILTGGDPEWDWGIIRMPNGNLGATVGWFTVANLLSPTLERVDLVPAMVGYPGDVSPPGSMWAGIKQQFVDVEPFTLFHDIDTFPGQSGSAVFVGDLDSPLLGFIVGIHTSGLGSVNAASRIDEELLSDLQLGCAEMGCSLESFTEPAASFHQITNARACVSTPLCQGGPETLVTGKQAWAAFGISPLPSKMLEGELFWKGEFLKQVAWPAPPYGPGGFNLDNNVLGKPATPGFFELRLWVGGLYVGAITMEVKPASASPPPNPVLLHRKRFGAIARD
jgi:glutamyl endopeptidase